MTQKKRRGGRAPVGRGPIGKRAPQRTKNLGDVKVSPAVHAWMLRNGLLATEMADLVYSHIDMLAKADKPNSRGAMTMHTIPGTTRLGMAVMKINGGHMILFLEELDPGDFT